MPETFDQKTKRDVYFSQLDRELTELIDEETGLLSTKYSSVVPCPLCKEERDFTTLFVKRGYAFVQCQSCGLVFTNPQVDATKLKELYKHAKSNEMWIDVLLSASDKAWRLEYFQSHLDILGKLLGRKGSLLDIGCSIGQFMGIARDRGWQTIGLELSRKGAEYARAQGLDVRECLLQDAGFQAETFDAITAFGLLEHLNDPLDLISRCRTLLKKNGIFLVVVPNLYSLTSMTLREKTVTFDGRNHLIYFGEPQLRRLFLQAGYEVEILDTMLAGLDSVERYMAYKDPYSSTDGPDFLPQTCSRFFQGETRKTVEKWICDNGLGLRLRLAARKT